MCGFGATLGSMRWFGRFLHLNEGAPKARLRDFFLAFREHWFAAMSGGFSVPFTVAAVFSDNKYAQIIFAILAFSSAWFAAYRVWRIEREKVISLGALINGMIEPEKTIAKLIELQEQGLLLYKGTNHFPEDYIKALQEWEKTVADFIREHYSSAELHAFKTYVFFNDGEYTLPNSIPDDWREATKDQRVQCTARIVALNRTIQSGSTDFLVQR